MELREAYERARAKCKTPKSNTETPASNTGGFKKTLWGDEKIQLSDFNKPKQNIQYTIEIDTEPLPGENARAVLSEVIQTLENPKQQNKLPALNKLLDDTRIESIDEFAIFEGYFINYLLEKTKFNTNIHIHDYHMKLRKYVPPILLPALSKPIFIRMGWDKHNYTRHYSQKLEWLAYQFGVHVKDNKEEYWYREKQIRDRTLLRIQIDESDMHPGLMLMIGISVVIMFGVIIRLITDYV